MAVKTMRVEGLAGGKGHVLIKHLLDAEQVAQIQHCDVLLVPVGGTYTLDVRTAKQVADTVAPRIVIPMHYRKGEMGFDVLQTLDEFTAQYDAQSVHYLSTNTVELSEEVLAHGGAVVPQI